MKFGQILVWGISEGDLEPAQWQKLSSMAGLIVKLPKDSKDASGYLPSTDCLLINQGMAADRQAIDSAPNLKYIGILATGYGRIDAGYAASKGIVVCNVAGYSTESVAEFAFAVLLEHIREIGRAKAEAKGGNYSEAGFAASEIRRKKFGIIGAGRIGARIAGIAKNGFAADVCYWSRKRKPDLESMGINYSDLDTLLAESDMLSINLSLTPETNGLLSAEKIRLMKKGAILLNLAPMELIDSEGLEGRLRANDLTFIMDHSDEIPKEAAQKLSSYPNCILYPPIGFITNEASAVKREILIANLENFLAGRPTNRVY